jgi:hypothetical protein
MLKRSVLALVLAICAESSAQPALAPVDVPKSSGSPPVAARGDESVQVRYIWNKGQVLRYRTTATSESKDPAGPPATPQRFETAQVWRLEVQSVDAVGAAVIRVTAESVRVETGRPDGAVQVFDSTRPRVGGAETDPLLAVHGRLVGMSLTMEMEADGRVRRVSGMDEALGRRTDPKSATKLDGEVNDALDAVRPAFNDKAMAEMLQSGFALVPDRPVRLGETWPADRDVEIPLMGRMLVRGTTELDGIELRSTGRVAHLVTRGSFKLDQSAAAAPAVPGVKMVIGDATVHARTSFDLNRGRLMQSVYESTVPMETELDLGGGSTRRSKLVTISRTKTELVEEGRAIDGR